MTKPWAASMPQTPKRRNRKRCYTVWRAPAGFRWTGGKVVWLTDQELTLALIKYPDRQFREVLARDLLQEYKKYLDQTIE